MKKIFIFLSFLVLAISFIACERDDVKAKVDQSAPASNLSELSADSMVLVLENAGNVFQAFSWTQVNYGFDASVTYKLQVDVKGNNFANAVDIASVNNGLTTSISVGEFNKILLDKELEPETPVDLEFRVSSTVNPNLAPLYSNVVEASVTPYATSFPPIFMCGAATGGWDWTKSVGMRSSAPKVYQTIAYFIGGETFRFFKQHNWGPTSYNYPFFDGGFVSDSLENALDGDLNFKVLAPSGYYSITVDLKNKTVDLDAVDEPVMFMTGAALGGWDWSTNYVKMTWDSNGVFEATTDFLNGETFRFFAQQDWNPISYNYPHFSDGSIDPLFENANDGDKNFRFIGTTGSYKIVLNMLDNIITMKPQ